MFPAALETEILLADETIGFVDIRNPIWIYGAGNFGAAVARAFQKKGATIKGFIETNPQKSTWVDLPVLSVSAVRPDAKDQVAIGIFNRESAYGDISDLIRDAGVGNVHWPFDFYAQIVDEIGSRYWLSTKMAIKSEIADIKAAYLLLSDDRSRTIFQRIIRFRLGLDLEYSRFIDAEEQYFSDITLPALNGASLCYVDAGAFTGDTYRALCKHVRPTDAYLFEPDSRNYAKLVSEVQRDGANAKCLPLALSNGYGIMSFVEDGEGSAISDNGSRRIATASLDGILANTPVDFLKLDIEGSEIDALCGAKKLISNSRPIIGVSIYHKPDDMWRIPLLIRSMVDDYSFLIRQHMVNSFESVLYAVPNTRRHRLKPV